MNLILSFTICLIGLFALAITLGRMIKQIIKDDFENENNEV